MTTLHLDRMAQPFGTWAHVLTLEAGETTTRTFGGGYAIRVRFGEQALHLADCPASTVLRVSNEGGRGVVQMDDDAPMHLLPGPTVTVDPDSCLKGAEKAGAAVGHRDQEYFDRLCERHDLRPRPNHAEINVTPEVKRRTLQWLRRQ